MRQVDRLAEALEKQPAIVEGNERIFKQPIYITANAKGFKVSPKLPKDSAKAGGYSISFGLKSVALGRDAITAMTVAVALGCFRIRNAILASQIMADHGLFLDDVLEEQILVCLDQIETIACIRQGKKDA